MGEHDSGTRPSICYRNIAWDGGCVVLLAPHWPAQAWFACWTALASERHLLEPTADAPQLLESSRPVNSDWEVVLEVIGWRSSGRLESAKQCCRGRGRVRQG